MALFAYIAYVDTTEDIVIDSLASEKLADVLGYMFCGVIIGSMPIQLNPVSDMIFRIKFFDRYVPLFRDNPTSKYYIGALASILLCACIALVIPGLALMLGIVGSFCGIFTMTIFPVLFYNKVFYSEMSNLKLAVHITM